MPQFGVALFGYLVGAIAWAVVAMVLEVVGDAARVVTFVVAMVDAMVPNSLERL